ncbi:MAG: V-type ATP synthase subunit D [Pirellulaceae bacterium]|nr:V-type ATP synthase subunit D [Pirellulaceae bacterium]
MPKLNVAPTKSSYLELSRQLDSAKEGYDLLDQKRQILVYELMSRLGRARDAERRLNAAVAPAHEALREAVLDVGSAGVDRASLAVVFEHQVELSQQNLMGIRLPTVTAQPAELSVQFGFGGTSAQTDTAMRKFIEVLPLLAELAELENSVIRLARELRKTQRRCNALSKVFIPDYSETIDYILSNLEERERESFIIQKMIKDRLTREAEGSVSHV